MFKRQKKQVISQKINVKKIKSEEEEIQSSMQFLDF